MVLYHKHQVTLDGFQTWCNIATQCWKDFLFNDVFLKFLYLSDNILGKFNPDITGVFNDAVKLL